MRCLSQFRMMGWSHCSSVPALWCNNAAQRSRYTCIALHCIAVLCFTIRYVVESSDAWYATQSDAMQCMDIWLDQPHSDPLLQLSTQTNSSFCPYFLSLLHRSLASCPLRYQLIIPISILSIRDARSIVWEMAKSTSWRIQIALPHRSVGGWREKKRGVSERGIERGEGIGWMGVREGSEWVREIRVMKGKREREGERLWEECESMPVQVIKTPRKHLK